jgi:serine/threonine-protein kinase
VINLKRILPEDFFGKKTEVVEIQIPNLVNLKISDAKLAAQNMGLKIITEEKFLENATPDIVLGQFPLPGFKAQKGDAVKLEVSKAMEITFEVMSEDEMMEEIELSPKIVMPDITGLNSDTAKDLLVKSGIIRISENFSEDDLIDKGRIISFNPPAGSEVDETATVDIVISKGPSIKMVIVPNLYNKTLDGAKNLIAQNKLKLGKVNKITDIDKGFDRIIGQSVQWGEKVKEGTVIDIDLNTEAEDSVGW